MSWSRVAVEDPCSGLKQQMSAARRPSHRLTLVKAFVHDLVDRGLHEASGDAFIGAEPLTIIHDVAHVIGDVRGELPERGGKLSERRRGGVLFQSAGDIIC
jgi:hypothetical protein